MPLDPVKLRKQAEEYRAFGESCANPASRDEWILLAAACDAVAERAELKRKADTKQSGR